LLPPSSGPDDLYGEGTHRYVRRFETLRIKKVKFALMMEAARFSETLVNFY
jgi:hypothetical protein